LQSGGHHADSPAPKLTGRQRTVRDRLREIFREDDTCPHGLLPPERQLAEMVGVSRPTVRMVLSHLEDRGEVLRGNGSRRVAPNEADRPAGRMVIGVIDTMLDSQQPSSSLPSGSQATIVATAREAIGRAGAHALFLGHCDWDALAIDDLRQQRLSGLLVFRHAIDQTAGSRIIESMRACGTPTVVYGYSDGLPPVHAIGHDHEQGQYLATRHLIERRGCRRIARVWRAMPDASIPAWVHHREIGYQRAMREAGLAVPDPILLPDFGDIDDPARRFELLRRLIAGYLTERKGRQQALDGLVCLSDGHAIAAAAACRLIGRSPGEDVHLAGYDNMFQKHDFCSFEPSLPAVTIDKNNPCLGKALGELLLACIADSQGSPVRQHLHPPRLVIPSSISASLAVNDAAP
jgi:DNA-binding LacI/PurR family transcriptional regulator